MADEEAMIIACSSLVFCTLPEYKKKRKHAVWI